MAMRPDSEVPVLSALIHGASSRRGFLARGAVAGAAVAAGCRRGERDAGRETETPDSLGRDPGAFNSSSRADTALALDHQRMSETPAVALTDPVPYRRFDPVLPPLSQERTVRLHWRSREIPIHLGRDLVVAGWTFEGDIPGPVVHVRQGDTVEFTLTNEGAVPHSMDFHAAQIDPRQAFRSVAQGESVTFTFQPRYAGAFMYHCGTAPVLMHIGTGMYGALIVSPRDPLPEAREFVLVQSELYLGPAVDGVAPFDYRKMMSMVPDHVVFNGRPEQYVQEPITVRQGERVRFHVVSAGPQHPCAFHVVGEQFEKVYIGSPPNGFIEGVQTFNIPAGGGMSFEFVADVVGEFPFVNHGFGHGQRGAIGFLNVEP